MERIKKQIETFTAILYELRNEQRRDYDINAHRDDVVMEPGHRKGRNEEVPSLGG